MIKEQRNDHDDLQFSGDPVIDSFRHSGLFKAEESE